VLNNYLENDYVQGSTAGMTDDINDQLTLRSASGDRKNAFLSLMTTQNVEKRYDNDVKVYKQKAFSACEMPLNEMNVHSDSWGDNRPNSMFYDEPSGDCNVVYSDSATSSTWKDYKNCENDGGTASSWPFGLTALDCTDCYYEDGEDGIRQKAVDGNWTNIFSDPL